MRGEENGEVDEVDAAGGLEETALDRFEGDAATPASCRVQERGEKSLLPSAEEGGEEGNEDGLADGGGDGWWWVGKRRKKVGREVSHPMRALVIHAYVPEDAVRLTGVECGDGLLLPFCTE